jgi:sec-independent protein translocase protein TatC
MAESENDTPREPSGDASEPESAFDALPDPAPAEAAASEGAASVEAAGAYDPTDGWPYTDLRPSAEAAPGDRAPERGYDAAPAESDDEPEPVRGDMGFFDHLEELRSRIIKALLGVVAGAIVAAVYSRFLIQDVLLAPARNVGVKLLDTRPMGQVTLTLQVVLICGLVVAIPWVIWQFWQFVKPGLYPKERKYSSWIAVATIFCFLAGISFAYFILVPTSLDFAVRGGIVYDEILQQWSISEYFSFVLGFVLACGVVFEMPMLSFALARFGILTPAFLRHYRRHSAVVILIIAAIITPTPDPFNQLVLAVPLYALFEISIIVAAAASRKREEAYAEMFSDDDIVNTADKDDDK